MSVDLHRTKRAPAYTVAEDDQIIAMVLVGLRDRKIAAAIGRTHKAVRNRLTKLRRAGRLPPARQPKP